MRRYHYALGLRLTRIRIETLIVRRKEGLDRLQMQAANIYFVQTYRFKRNTNQDGKLQNHLGHSKGHDRPTPAGTVTDGAR